MPLAGRELTVEEALALCYKVGFRKASLRTAVAVMTAESGRFVEAWGLNVRPEVTVREDGAVVVEFVKSLDRGLFQVNTIHVASLGLSDSFRAVPNARKAFAISSQGTNWTPWSAFNSGRYLNFLPEVTSVHEAGAWRALLPTIIQELGGE